MFEVHLQRKMKFFWSIHRNFFLKQYSIIKIYSNNTEMYKEKVNNKPRSQNPEVSSDSS